MGHGIRRHCRGLAALAVLACFTAAPTSADDAPGAISAEAAQRLERQAHAWLASMLGPHVTIGERPLHITAESDHYRIELPFAAALSDATGATIEADPISAELKPLDGGRWRIDDFRWPSPLHASFALSERGEASGTEKLTVTIADQEQHGVLDPSLATPSVWDARIKGYASQITGMKDDGSRKATIDEAVAHLRWEPTSSGRVSVRETSEAHLITTNAVAANVGLRAMSIERMQGQMQAEDVAPAQVAQLLRAMMVLVPIGLTAEKQALAGGGAANDRPSKLNDKERAAARDTLMALAGLLGGFEEHWTAENLHIVGNSFSWRVAKLMAGFGAGTPDGRSAVHFDVALDGLESPDVPPGVLRDNLPHHVAIALSIGGIRSSDLHALLLRAADSKGSDPKLKDAVLGLLAKEPLVVGLDNVELDFGPAQVRGKGEVRLSNLDHYQGEAHIAARGLDKLIKEANGVPDLAQAMPALFMLKGIGKQDGDKTVWNVAFHDRELLVNGNDMSSMVPRDN